MLPKSSGYDALALTADTYSEERTKTFYLNLKENIAGGSVDEVEALKQTIYMILNTEADQYIIYDYEYGIKTIDLFGKPHYYVMAVIPNRIKTALMYDNRITDVTDFEFEIHKRDLNVKFVVHTVYGDIVGERVVSY